MVIATYLLMLMETTGAACVEETSNPLCPAEKMQLPSKLSRSLGSMLVYQTTSLVNRVGLV